ncbi:hypothetical protein BT96DRAFT_946732 [Gymnopus androsaceus JB14]|uniref:Uncharacterized protein n=1 Tax=Gymnopus androsaceus JB14 TaxID=1447944 RepID=A0A6A4GUU6_9AGAR|nr:hypothetical protein BT96DRAFT_946732 [Gymnopus androsaceus JB14]
MCTFAFHLTWALSAEETNGNKPTGALALAAAAYGVLVNTLWNLTKLRTHRQKSVVPGILLTARIFEASAALLPDIPTAGAGPAFEEDIEGTSKWFWAKYSGRVFGKRR